MRVTMVNKVCMPSDLPTLFSLQRVRIVTKARISPLEGESWFYTHEAGGGFKALDAHLGAGVLCIGCCKLRDGLHSAGHHGSQSTMNCAASGWSVMRAHQAKRDHARHGRTRSGANKL